MNEVVIEGLARMIVMEWAFRALLVAGGLLSAGFFHCSANFLTSAPHAVKLAVLPVITGAGIGMAFFGITGDVLAGAMVSVIQVAAILTLWFVVWEAGAHISKVFARQAAIRHLDRKSYELMMREITEPTYDMADILTPSGFAELEKEKAK